MPDSCAFEFELFIEKTKSHKSPGINQIPAELINAGRRIIRSEIHSLFFLLGIRRKCLRMEAVDHCTYL